MTVPKTSTAIPNIKYISSQPENKYAQLVANQKIVLIPEFELESGYTLNQVPIAFKTWGKLNTRATNCIVITHALSGSSDIADWWGPLLGKGKAFDPSKYFIICLNSLGSPYGSASPVTLDPATKQPYGPQFPLTTIRDDVRIHKLVLDFLGVQQVAAVVGGSMGGMLALEYPSIFNIDDGDSSDNNSNKFVRSIIVLASSARHSAWCISWSEAQRQSIYTDPKYRDGYYYLYSDGDGNNKPVSGLGAARMAALLTYRSKESFESRFGRNDPYKVTNIPKSKLQLPTPPSSSGSLDGSDTKRYSSSGDNWTIHNDGKNYIKGSAPSSTRTKTDTHGTSVSEPSAVNKKAQTFFTAQNYLRYQGNKFVNRFDANCYIAITRKMDTHDLARDRYVTKPNALTGHNHVRIHNRNSLAKQKPSSNNNNNTVLEPITMEQHLNKLNLPSLIIGISSDGLFNIQEQEYLAQNMPRSEFHRIESPEGHDAFLLEFQEINEVILQFEEKHLEDLMEQQLLLLLLQEDKLADGGVGGGIQGSDLQWGSAGVPKASLFGEVEDVTSW